jgi:hypothetical protein
LEGIFYSLGLGLAAIDLASEFQAKLKTKKACLASLFCFLPAFVFDSRFIPNF